MQFRQDLLQFNNKQYCPKWHLCIMFCKQKNKNKQKKELIVVLKEIYCALWCCAVSVLWNVELNWNLHHKKSTLVGTVGFVTFKGVKTNKYRHQWIGLASVSTACVYETWCLCDTLPSFSAMMIPDVTWQPQPLSVSPEYSAYLGQYVHEAMDQSGHSHHWKVIQGPTWQLRQLCW